jgi:hypothetical protein
VNVRLSTVDKGRTFTYKGKLYVMGGLKKDPKMGGTFRWVQNAETGKWIKFTVHGSALVTLGKTKVKATTPAEVESASGRKPRRVVRRPVQKDKTHRSGGATREKVVKVLVSKGANTYRVTAKWWAGKSGWQRKEFRVNANSASAALAVVQKNQQNKNVRVTFTVAKVSE